MSAPLPASGPTHAAALMDGIYRRQRFIYDATRKYYLLGRDRLIADLDAREGMTVLEVGCGTGRNLAAVARRYPGARLHGFDISAAMLETAATALGRKGLSGTVMLRQADATTFTPALFGRTGFDRIYISYTLSMIPGWRTVLRQAAAALAPGGTLMVVDFGQQEGLPRWFRAALFAWLRRFHVHPDASLPTALSQLAAERGLTFQWSRPFAGYAIAATLTRPPMRAAVMAETNPAPAAPAQAAVPIGL